MRRHILVIILISLITSGFSPWVGWGWSLVISLIAGVWAHAYLESHGL